MLTALCRDSLCTHPPKRPTRWAGHPPHAQLSLRDERARAARRAMMLVNARSASQCDDSPVRTMRQLQPLAASAPPGASLAPGSSGIEALPPALGAPPPLPTATDDAPPIPTDAEPAEPPVTFEPPAPTIPVIPPAPP